MRVLVMTKDPGSQGFSEVIGYPEMSSITGLVLSGLFGEGGCLFLLQTKSDGTVTLRVYGNQDLPGETSLNSRMWRSYQHQKLWGPFF